MRIGHDEREHVLGLLTGAREAGLLTLEEYDDRIVHVGTATHAGELTAQLKGLPSPYVWEPPPPPAAAGTMALALGIASIPLSLCVVGGILGILAVIASRGGGPRPGGPRVTAALVGRVLGIIGVALSLAALAALFYVRNTQLGP